MNSRKAIIAPLLIVALLCIMCGCNQHKQPIQAISPYTVWDVSMGDVVGVWEQASSPEYLGPVEKTITINGKSYTGTYASTSNQFPNWFATSDRFFAEDKAYFFSLDHNTGNLVLFYRYPEKFENDDSGESSENRDDYKILADLIAKDYIDLDMYSVDETGIREYTYYRKLSGFSSCNILDALTIGLTADGDLALFQAQGLGTFDDVNKISIDKEEVQKAFEGKMTELSTNIETGSVFTGYDVDRYWLVKTENDLSALCIDVKINYQKPVPETGGTIHGGELKRILIIL